MRFTRGLGYSLPFTAGAQLDGNCLCFSLTTELIETDIHVAGRFVHFFCLKISQSGNFCTDLSLNIQTIGELSTSEEKLMYVRDVLMHVRGNLL